MRLALLAALFVSCVRPAPLHLPDGGPPRDGAGIETSCMGSHCYVLLPEAQTWARASLSCAEHGGHVVVVGSADEEAAVWSFASRAEMPVWIGATDEGSEGTWRWVDAEAWSPMWGPGQPDNAAMGENCAAMWAAFDGAWADVSCDAMLPVVCEIEP